MKNIDKELIDWAITQIKNNYPNDVDLLIGQKGACKTPDDAQTMAFDFFIPATEAGNNLAKTFVIEDMGYDLYPISWQRLKGIVNLEEPRMIFAFMKGEIIYSRTPEAEQQFLSLKKDLLHNLQDKKITFTKALEFLQTAMEIYLTMMFEEDICTVRKASGGIACQLMNGIAMVNGQYLKNGYGNLSLEMTNINNLPVDFESTYNNLLDAKTIDEIQSICHKLIKSTRNMFFALKKQQAEEENTQQRKVATKEATGACDSYSPCGTPNCCDSVNCTDNSINYDDLANWYQEARYSFRRIEYYAKQNSKEDCFLLGCYLQIEFDAIKDEFDLKTMDLLGAFESSQLTEFAKRAEKLENYIVGVLKEHKALLKIYKNFEDFAANVLS